MLFFILATLVSEDDPGLISRLKKRDPGALEEAYERHGKLAYAVILRIVREPSTAQDLLQETFLRVWVRIQRFDERRGALGPWIVTIARNQAIDYLRSAGYRKPTQTGGLENLEQPHLFHDFETEYVVMDQVRAVRAAFTKLSQRQQEVLQLAYFEGLSQTEMAERLAQPLGTVKTWVRTALQTLRRELRPAERPNEMTDGLNLPGAVAADRPEPT